MNVVAVDGSKISANASREATVDYERLAREIVEEGLAVDAEEDARFGDRRGDELPPEVATSIGRREWFKAARRWLDDERAEQAAPIARDRPERVKEAKRRMDEQLSTEMRAEEAYQRYRAKGVDRRGGRLGPNTVPRPYVAPPVPVGTINTTDLDSNLVKGQHGWLQGYNAQAASNEHRIVIAAEIQVISPDFGHLEPIVTAARRELAGAGVTDTPKVVVADSGYWHTEQMDRLAADGIAVLIPPESGLRKTPAAGLEQRPLRLHAQRPADRARHRPLQAATTPDRDPVRLDQTQPRLRPLPPTRQSRRPDRVAPDHRDTQPPQAPQAPTRNHGGLTLTISSASHPRRQRPQTYATAPSRNTTFACAAEERPRSVGGGRQASSKVRCERDACESLG